MEIRPAGHVRRGVPGPGQRLAAAGRSAAAAATAAAPGPPGWPPHPERRAHRRPVAVVGVDLHRAHPTPPPPPRTASAKRTHPSRRRAHPSPTATARTATQPGRGWAAGRGRAEHGHRQPERRRDDHPGHHGQRHLAQPPHPGPAHRAAPTPPTAPAASITVGSGPAITDVSRTEREAASWHVLLQDWLRARRRMTARNRVKSRQCTPKKRNLGIRSKDGCATHRDRAHSP